MNINKLFFKNISYRIIFFKIIRILIIIYSIVLVFLYFNQKNMIYYPDYPRSSNFYECPFYEKSEKKDYKNTRFYERKWEKNNVIVFFHWNAWSMCDRENIRGLFEKTGNSILMVEYYWYAGLLETKPDIKNTLEDVLNIWEYLQKSDYDNTYVVWRSVWTWPASYFSNNFKTEKLLLISPYSQLYKVAKNQYPYFPIKYLFTQNYNNEEYLKDYLNELLIIHWDNDNIVPIEFWEDLYYWVNTKNKDLLKVVSWDHNNLLYKEEVSRTIIDFLK